MLRNYLKICVALGVAAMAYGQLGGILGGDSDDDNGHLIRIGILEGSKDKPVKTVDPSLIKPGPTEKRRMIVLPTDEQMQPFVPVNNKYYYFGHTKVSWYKAYLICRSLNGHLAAFDTQQESAAINSYLISQYPTDRWWWLSAADLDTEGDFFWYKTGQRMYNADWSVGQPDNHSNKEHCVHLWFTGSRYQMNDWVCNGKAYYICEKEFSAQNCVYPVRKTIDAFGEAT